MCVSVCVIESVFVCCTVYVCTKRQFCLPSLFQEAQAADPVTVDSSGRPPSALAPVERRPSGSPLSSLGVALGLCRGVGGSLRSLRHAATAAYHQVAPPLPLDLSFLCTYCAFLFTYYTLNLLLELLQHG